MLLCVSVYSQTQPTVFRLQSTQPEITIPANGENISVVVADSGSSASSLRIYGVVTSPYRENRLVAVENITRKVDSVFTPGAGNTRIYNVYIGSTFEKLRFEWSGTDRLIIKVKETSVSLFPTGSLKTLDTTNLAMKRGTDTNSFYGGNIFYGNTQIKTANTNIARTDTNTTFTKTVTGDTIIANVLKLNGSFVSLTQYLKYSDTVSLIPTKPFLANNYITPTQLNSKVDTLPSLNALAQIFNGTVKISGHLPINQSGVGAIPWVAVGLAKGDTNSIGLNVVNTTINTTRNSQSQARDTTSISMWLTAWTGKPMIEARDNQGRLTFQSDSVGRLTTLFDIQSGNDIYTFNGRYFGMGSNGTATLGVFMKANSDGVFTVYNAAISGFTRQNFGGTTSLFSAIKNNSGILEIVKADDSGYNPLVHLYRRNGTGSPEGVVTAPIGTIYIRTDGTSGSILYFKDSGSGNTGWVAKW